MLNTCITERISIGISGLDQLLHGGLIPNRSYLLRGGPGTGKTTLGLHFLAEGLQRGENALFITLSESEKQLRQTAKDLNPVLRDLAILDLSPTSDFFAEIQSYDIFSPAEVEREPVTNLIVGHVEKLQPKRVFIDSMTQFRFLSPDQYQFRKQVLSLIQFLLEQGATLIFTSEGCESTPDDDLQFLCDSIINLLYTAEGLRNISVSKFRGSGFQGGPHSMRLSKVGMEIFPRLVPSEHGRSFIAEPLSSGIPALDELLHGGFERGTITIISGPTGVGKTTLGLQFMNEAACRGERSVVFSFEEDPALTLLRCESISIPARTMIDQGTLSLVKIEPLIFTPDEFANLVRKEVEEKQARMVMIDSTAGYQISLRGDDPVPHLHSLCKYLQNMGVATLLINEKETVSGEYRVTELGISYLADNIVFIQYLERFEGRKVELRKAIGVLKKRLSSFERTIREYEVTSSGLRVSDPLPDLDHIIGGLPRWAVSSEGTGG